MRVVKTALSADSETIPIFSQRTTNAYRGDNREARKIHRSGEEAKYNAATRGGFQNGQTAKARSGHRVQSLLK